MATSALAATGASTGALDFLNAGSGARASAAAPDAAQQNERFLKLLTAQLQNQDPLNPMDNAQMTSQVAQISTVTGIEKLDASIGKLSASMLQSQTLQSAGLVGRQVEVPGNGVTVDDDDRARGGFELTSAADRVRVDLLDAAGRVVGGADLGARSSGRQDFDIDAASAAGASRFRVSAYSGATALDVTTYAFERVESVASSPTGGVTLQLGSGREVAFDTVRAVH